MTTDPIRAALERLHQYAETFPEHDTDAIVAAARAALAAEGKAAEELRFPFTVEQLRDQWNAQADEFNQWESLGLEEQIGWAQVRAARAEAAAPPTVYEWVVRVGDHWLASGSGPILERVEEEANYWLQYTHTGVGMAQIRAVQIIKEITP